MVCPNCGASNPPESSFCGGCGSILPSKPESAANAGASIPASAIPSSANSSSGMDETVATSGSESDSQLTYQSPQPAPSASEVVHYGAPQSQSNPEQSIPGTSYATPGQPAFPGYPAATPVQSSGPSYPAATPGSASYPGQPGAPSYPAATPVQSSGPSYPVAASGQMSGASYQQVTPVPGTPVGYSAPGQMSGAYPPQTPVPNVSGASYPGQPSGAFYPGQPSGVSYPSQPSGASYPGYPAYQASGASYPGQPSMPGWPGYSQQPVAPKEPSSLIKPLPLWAFIGSIIVVALVLLLLVFFGGADWAAGAQTAGTVAVVVGILVLVAFGVRAALGLLAQTNPHRRNQVISTILLALLLFAFGAVALTQDQGIHGLQAHVLEGQHKWQSAIDEYKLGGQREPASTDLARVYNAWGEDQLNQEQYEAALANFQTVMTNYDQAGDQVSVAQKDAVSTYLHWGNQAVQDKQYADATKHYDDLLNQTYCNTDCKNQATAADATAYYDLAEQQLNKQDYTSAVTAFTQLTTKFGSTADAKKAHVDYAKALWGEGQADLSKACSNAVTIYQQLSSQFSDTNEGQQATNDLKKPQKVIGQFTSTIPSGSDVPVVGLVKGVTSDMDSNAFYAILDKSPQVPVNTDGTFSFDPQAQDTYYLVWGIENASKGRVFYVGQHYPATVGPLCTFDFGSISSDFPTFS